MIRKTFFVVCFCTALTAFAQSPRQPPGRPEWNDDGILVNPVGFTTKSAKFCMLKIDADVDFKVVNAADGKQAFAGTFEEDALYIAEERYMVSEGRTPWWLESELMTTAVQNPGK